MARVRQFAKDMGMSYNQAKNLVNKGRNLKDGGSSVLESTMNKVKPVMASNGKFTKTEKDPEKMSKMKMKSEMFKDTVKKSTEGKITPQEAMKQIRKIVTRSDGGGANLKPIPEDNPGLKALKKERPDVVAKMGFKKMGGTLNYREGGQFRGCGAQVKGKKFKGIF